MNSKNANKKYFSVIICTYNRANLLKRALNSLLKQTFSDWEVILIDDGSTDNTKEVVKPYLEKQKNFSYFYQENKGIAEARNFGLSVAKGKYCTFLDSDDEYCENHLETRYAILSSNPNIVLLHGGVQIIGNEFVPDKSNTNTQINLSECVIGGTFFVKTEVAIALKGFRKQYSEDSEFFDRAVKNGYLTEKTDLKTYIYYRDTADSICNKMKE